MSRGGLLRLCGRLGIVGAALALLLAACVYIASERVLHRKFEIPLTDIEVPIDSASVAEGGRLVEIRGCRGCHGEELQGRVFQDDFEARIVAPDLTRAAADYSASELARAIRQGVRANGEGLWQMPSDAYYHLSDDDLGRIIAFLRAAPRVEGGLDYQFRPGPLVRWGMMTGDWWAVPEDVRQLGPRTPTPDPADTLAHGEYLARTACTECHGADLQGGGAPDLAIARAYSFDDFKRFMRSGAALGGRKLPRMSRIARFRFSHFTEAELSALYAFLQARARSRGAHEAS